MWEAALSPQALQPGLVFTSFHLAEILHYPEVSHSTGIFLPAADDPRSFLTPRSVMLHA